MSWDTAWQLPGPEVDRQAVEAAVQKALSEFPGVVRGSDIDEDLAEFAEDFAADEEVVEDRLEFALGLPEALVREHAEGRLEGEPDDDGLYWGEFSLTPGFDGWLKVAADSNRRRESFDTYPGGALTRTGMGRPVIA